MRMIKIRFLIFLFLTYIPQLSAEIPSQNTAPTPLDNYQIIPIDYQNISAAENVRDTWKKNNITSYVFNIINKCFCDIAIRARIFVHNNKIVKILDLDKGNAPLDKSKFHHYKTIDEYIVFINNILKNPVDKVYIDHDRHLGFPSKIFIDPNKRQADDETNIDISHLSILIVEPPISPSN